MKKLFLILTFILVHTLSFSQDSLKKFFLFVQVGGLAQINIDNNEKHYYSYCAGINFGVKAKKNILIQTGLEYSKVNFYCSHLNDGPGYDETSNYFQINKLSIPVYVNYITDKNNFIVGGGPVIDAFNAYTRSFVVESYDFTTHVTSILPSSETRFNFDPLYISFAVKADYLVPIGKLKFIIGLKMKCAIYNMALYSNKGNSYVNYRDYNASFNLGVVF